MNTEQIRIKLVEIKKSVILKWLTDNDYIINKIVLGEWQEDDERFIKYKQDRAIKREQLDALELELIELTTPKVEEEQLEEEELVEVVKDDK